MSQPISFFDFPMSAIMPAIARVPRQRLAVMFALFALLLCGMQRAQAEQYFRTDARHAVIIDGATGTVLYDKGADTPIHPASMSKLMTVAVVLDLIDKKELRLETPFMVSEKAWRTGGSKMFVLVNTEITVEDLLKGVLVHSGNDAAIVLAENIAGSEEGFVRLMNERARAWGLDQSTFQNPMGMTHVDHKMSALDLGRLARLIWQRFPQYHYLFGIQEFTWSDITQQNRNTLLRSFPGTDGMKTGYTDAAGAGVVATATRDGHRRFVVIAGLPSTSARDKEANRMMELAFSKFDRRVFFQPGDIVAEAEVFGSADETVPLRIDVAVDFTLANAQLDGAKAKIVYQGPLPAPLREGEQVAVLELTMPGQPKREYPLYTAQPIQGLGVGAKMGIGLKALFTAPEEPIF